MQWRNAIFTWHILARPFDWIKARVSANIVCCRTHFDEFDFSANRMTSSQQRQFSNHIFYWFQVWLCIWIENRFKVIGCHSLQIRFFSTQLNNWNALIMLKSDGAGNGFELNRLNQLIRRNYLQLRTLVYCYVTTIGISVFPIVKSISLIFSSFAFVQTFWLNAELHIENERQKNVNHIVYDVRSWKIK